MMDVSTGDLDTLLGQVDDMADENNGGIIRWQSLQGAMQDLRREFREDLKSLEAAQDTNVEEIARLRSDVAALKSEIRIWGLILLGVLTGLIGLVLNHVMP